MKFKMIHENYNVSDLDRSIKFYNEALDLHASVIPAFLRIIAATCSAVNPDLVDTFSYFLYADFT